MPTRPTYASFLVRLWREDDPVRICPGAGWQGEVQYIQTGQRATFANLDELLDLMRQAAEEGEAQGEEEAR